MHDHMPSGPNRTEQNRTERNGTERMPSSSLHAKLLGNSSRFVFYCLTQNPKRQYALRHFVSFPSWQTGSNEEIVKAELNELDCEQLGLLELLASESKSWTTKDSDCFEALCKVCKNQ